MSEHARRLVIGAAMVAAVAGVLAIDPPFYPLCPCLFVSLVLVGVLCAAELHALAADGPRPPLWLAAGSTAAVIAANWPAHVGWTADPWRDVAGAFMAVLLAGFGWEMLRYRGQAGAVQRLALLAFTVAYVGLAGSFLAQLRWWGDDPVKGSAALALAVFVPKCGDMAAYGVGRVAGRTPMTPLLSPKKTWEGLAGGLAASVAVAVAVNLWHPLLSSAGLAALFGLSVGLAGVMGDLAESLIKRDFGRKDASGAVPGFGGLLDVADAVLFAAPVASWWLR
ncbi:MAG: phosphatidate cytidylyltransferase [Gemmataceae bacterium]